ncbi:MAG: VCBS repeat-containing protein [Acidobacteria bacterium]|nr:VCBS repeat-containing protein [Acidobacteriota bacterium]
MKRTKYSFITRITAMVLSIGLLTPMFGLSDFAEVRAAVSAAPASDPPIPFTVQSSGLFTDHGGMRLASFISSVYALIAPAPLPAGLEQPDSRPVPADPNAFSPPPPPHPSASVDFDFDGDGKADVAQRHPSNSEWKIKNSNGANYTTATVGSSSAMIAPGDFDGDDKTDMAVFSAGTWTIRKSSNSQTETVSFGASGDRPVVGDYDGDDVSDCAVFRPSTNTWWIKQSTNGQTVSSAFGAAGDITAQGDFDGDAKTDVTVFRPSSGDWHVSGSTAGYFTFHWGSRPTFRFRPITTPTVRRTSRSIEARPASGTLPRVRIRTTRILRNTGEITATSLFRPITTATTRRISPSGARRTASGTSSTAGRRTHTPMKRSESPATRRLLRRI